MRMWNEMIGLFFPRRCVLCDGLMEQEDGMMHGACVKQLYPVEAPVCYHCGRPIVSERGEYCFDCERNLRQFGYVTFQQGKALYLYAGDMKISMYRFKYCNRREYAAYFARMCQERYAEWIARNGIEAIVPVPMYWKKEQLRGYNQALVLARALGRELAIPVEGRMVRRIRNTRPQKELNDLERKNNLKNAFQVSGNNVKYKKILVVDDIYTTGSTADAVAEALMQAGVLEVYFLSVCIGKGA